MKGFYRRKADSQKRIALERITDLFREAESNFNEYPALSRRYVVLARKIAMKYRVRFTRDQKKLFCKSCNAYLKQGTNSTVRIHKGMIILHCLECSHVRRFVYGK